MFIVDKQPDKRLLNEERTVHTKYDKKHTVIFHTPNAELVAKHLPDGSKLFLGNLPLHYEDKDELASVFAKYGDILDIKFHKGRKTGYAFIQFTTSEATSEAMANESGRIMSGGFKIGNFR
jgi:RNA recognition motif-containing protein